jgi:hypothetical protein
VQLKMAKSADIAKALCTVDPGLVLHPHRDKQAPTPFGDLDTVNKALFVVELCDKDGATREPAFRVLINLHPPGPDGKRSNTRRAAVAEAANKCKKDAMISLARDEVTAAMTEQVVEAAVGYVHQRHVYESEYLVKTCSR